MSFNQFVNAGTELKLEPEKTQRYVITGRATGKVIEVVVEAGQTHTVSAKTESLRIDSFEVNAAAGGHEGSIDFRLTQV